MFNLADITNEHHEEHNLKCPYIPDHPYRFDVTLFVQIVCETNNCGTNVCELVLEKIVICGTNVCEFNIILSNCGTNVCE